MTVTTFELFRDDCLPGIDRLDPSLTINGITVTPTLRYKGGDANGTNWAPWGYGETLTLQAGTAPTYNQGSPLLGTNDDSVKFNAGGYYQADNAAFGQIGTEDFVVELVFKFSDTNGLAIFGNYVLGGRYYYIQRNSGLIRIAIYDSATAASVSCAAMVADTWYHAICFLDRSGSGQWYVNGLVSAAAVSISAVGSLTGIIPLQIGALGNSAGQWNREVAYCAMWKLDNWLDTHLQATVAQERFYRLTGLYPQIAKGTKLPTAYTRATVASLDKYEGTNRIIYKVGAGWPRWCHRKDGNGIDFKGYLAEINVTNKLLQTENFITNWSPINSVEDGNTRIVDGDMEAVGTTAWTAGASATLSKQGSAHGGAQCLRVARSVSNNPYTTQSCLIYGKTYRVTGWARSDSSAVPCVGNISVDLWTGTTSTDWQTFDIIFIAVDGRLHLKAATSTGTTYAEFDDIVVHEYLPLDNFDNKIVDGNMEAADVSAWTAGSSATLTKKITTPHGGTQCLRVARNGVNNPFAYQTILVTGNAYRITGWARSDGSAIPRITAGASTVLFSATTTAIWQYFDVTWTHSETNLLIRLYAITSTGTQYAEFDDIQVSLLSAAPDKAITTMSLVADTTDTDHGVSQACTLTAATYTLSVFAKAGNKNWLYLSDDTVANCTCYFDLSTGAVGTAGAGAVGYIENWGSGWYRCSIVFTGTAVAHTIKIQSANADGDKDFAGDGSTINTYIWGSQCEGTDYMTSYFPTTTAAGARNTDLLRYKGDDGNLGGVGSEQKGTVSCKVLVPNYDNQSYLHAFSLNDGGVSTDRVVIYINTTEEARAVTAATGGNAGLALGTTDIVNGLIHSLRTTWKNNELKLFIDEEQEGATDTDCLIPINLDRIDIGMKESTVQQLNGIINNVKIYPDILRLVKGRLKIKGL